MLNNQKLTPPVIDCVKIIKHKLTLKERKFDTGVETAFRLDALKLLGVILLTITLVSE